MSTKDTLVVYVYGQGDPEYTNNFNYFLLQAVRDDDRCEYIILVQYDEHQQDLSLPKLPQSAKYVFHKSACFEWGAFGWLLASGHVNWYKYKYFMLLTSAVRGPFMPAYLRDSMHWTQPFIR